MSGTCTASSLRWTGHLQWGISRPTEAYLDINSMLRHRDWFKYWQGIRSIIHRNFLLPMVSFISYSVKCHKINGTKLYNRESGCIRYVHVISKYSQVRKDRNAYFWNCETHLGEYKTTQKYLQVRKISPCESFVKDCTCGVLEPPGPLT